ncbi:MAG: hypothetical protein OXN44_05520 [Acidimicrobiaceae bacterium]|nr:hypothetical protein [Acidimicrobiaceae bacterium]
MNDPTPTDDELISSYIDGEATLDEVARIEADPALRARVQEFQTAKDLLSAPVPPLPGSDVDRLIDNALAQSAASDQITDLAAARGIRSLRIPGLGGIARLGSPQRLATVAATLVLLAGLVGAVIALSSDSGDEMFASTSDDSAETADEYLGDEMADDGDDFDHPMDAPGYDSDAEELADWARKAEAGEPDSHVEAGPVESDEMTAEDDDMTAADDPADDSADDDMGDFADSLHSEQGVSDETREGSAARMSYRPLDLEIAEHYEALDALIDHTAEQWRELVAAGATAIPQVAEEQGIAEQALADAACGQELRSYIDALDHSVGSGGISVGETIIADSATTAVVVELSINAAEVLTAADPDCEIVRLATLIG